VYPLTPVFPEIVFWLSATVPVYVYRGFPVVLLLLRPMLRRPVRKQAIEHSVSLLIAAYNEAAVIEQKIQNALAGDYPAGRLEVAVASDGFTDGTAERAQRLEDGSRVRVFAYPQNRGKLHVLNDTVPQLRGEIVILSDAASMLYPDAIHRLVSNFADPRVGAVSGLYRVINTDAAGIGRSCDFYWRYETSLKTQESELDSCLDSHGSFHAIRKELYVLLLQVSMKNANALRFMWLDAPAFITGL
jgi:cellulose synthase/poly-beta-1,6-N-acetylglucosamine synthase-like glycosyltransferase